MKKNIIFSAISIPLFLFAGFLWFISIAPSKALDYATGSFNLNEIYEKVEFVYLIDKPGYMQLRGVWDAKRMVQNSRNSENTAWESTSFLGGWLFKRNSLNECNEKLHTERQAFLQSLDDLPDNGVVTVSDGRDFRDMTVALSHDLFLCRVSALEATLWRSVLLDKMTFGMRRKFISN